LSGFRRSFDTGRRSSSSDHELSALELLQGKPNGLVAERDRVLAFYGARDFRHPSLSVAMSPHQRRSGVKMVSLAFKEVIDEQLIGHLTSHQPILTGAG
jgi:hypothetical protein